MALWSSDPVEQARLKSQFFTRIRRQILLSNQAGGEWFFPWLVWVSQYGWNSCRSLKNCFFHRSQVSLMFSARSITWVQSLNRNVLFILSRSCCSKHHLFVGVRIGVRRAEGTVVLWWAAVYKTTGRWSVRPIGCLTSTMVENKSGTLVKARSKRLTGTPSKFKCVGLFTRWLILKESIKSFRAEPWSLSRLLSTSLLFFALKSPSRTMSISAALSRTDSRYWQKMLVELGGR